ncbi:MAG: TIR domain-containing protein [Actinomycetota bacterium]
MSEVEETHDFDIAVSFAGEDRDYVSEVVEGVKDGMKVFYDEDYVVETWGEDLVDFFTNLYQHRARFVVMFISRHDADKMWTNVERRSALARAITQRSAYILPVRLDDTQLEGLLPTVGYVDANRLGLSGLGEAIKMKVSGAEPAKPSNAVLDGKVPRSQEAIEALMTERTGDWEYLLLAGLPRQNMDKLEPKYRDFKMGYARRTGVHVERDDLLQYVQTATGSINAIIENFDVVLDTKVQEQAFGKPGEPGDVDRIIHLAERFVSVYEDFMDWSTELSGASTRIGEGSEALRALALLADNPVDTCRKFISDFVEQMDTITERTAGEENLVIEMPVTWTLRPPPNSTRSFVRHSRMRKTSEARTATSWRLQACRL